MDSTLAEEVKTTLKWVFRTVGYLVFLTELLLSTITRGKNRNNCQKTKETQEPHL